jgi:hypothetical protein
MRANALIPAIAALLAAGCGGEGARNEAATNQTGQSPETPAPAPSPPPGQSPPSAPPTAGAAIPAPFHGEYDASVEACSRPSDGRLVVTSTELRFHESIGSLRRSAGKGASEVEVEADFQGEGETWRSVRTLILSDGGETLTISGDDTSFVRVRCPAGGR